MLKIYHICIGTPINSKLKRFKGFYSLIRKLKSKIKRSNFNCKKLPWAQMKKKET